ncbi:hypothetical protein Tco_0615802 [Tanacetum coccineum]
MTKQGNFTQRTPQAKKQSDQASRQISKQASGSANAPYDLVFTAMGPPLGTTQTTATITSTEGLQRATFTTPPQTKTMTLAHQASSDSLGNRDVHKQAWTKALTRCESPPSSDFRGQSAQAPQRDKLVLKKTPRQSDAENGH